MKITTNAQRERLLANGCAQRATQDTGYGGIDFQPVVKLFTLDANATWLLTEIDPDDTDRAFGSCDLGLGCPELGYVNLSELAPARGRLGPLVERDRYFEADKPMSAYVAEARAHSGIVT
jgi:hypothetical protein